MSGGGFMKGCPAVALDTHVYQAWFDIRSQESFLENACSWRSRIRAIQVRHLCNVRNGSSCGTCATYVTAPGAERVVRMERLQLRAATYVSA